MKGYHRFQCKQYARVYLLVTFPSSVFAIWNTESITGNQYVNKINFLWIFYYSPKKACFEKQLYLQSATYTDIYSNRKLSKISFSHINTHLSELKSKEITVYALTFLYYTFYTPSPVSIFERIWKQDFNYCQLTLFAYFLIKKMPRTC